MTAPIDPVTYLTGILRYAPTTLQSMEGLLTKIPTRKLELDLTRNALHLHHQVTGIAQHVYHDERTQP